MNQMRQRISWMFGAGLLLVPAAMSQPVRVNPIPAWLTPAGSGQHVDQTGRHPDLVVTEIAGPAEVYAGETVLLNFAVENLGDPLGDGYTYQAEIVITPDLIVDAGDTLIGNFIVSQSNLGLQSMNVTIPTTLGAGNYYLGLQIVDPVPGDVNPANNTRLSDLFEIVRTDLELEDGSQITAFVRLPDPVGPTATVRVNNVGTDQSILLYSVMDLNAVPWLSFDPVSGVSVSGAEGSIVTLQFIHTGLLPGDYFTTLRFTNDLIPEDTQDLAIQLTVGQAYFQHGQVIEGEVSGAGDVDKITFHGIRGLKVAFRTKSLTGNIKPVLTIIDPDGLVEKVLNFKNSGKLVNKRVKLQKSGLYCVEITGKGATMGSYRIRTDREKPTKAKPHRKRLSNPAAGGQGSTTVLILPGAILEYVINPNSKFAGPVGTVLTTPSGNVFDVSGNSEMNADGSLVVSDLHLDEAGAFEIGVTGWGADPKAKVRVSIHPVQPRRAEGKIYLP